MEPLSHLHLGRQSRLLPEERAADLAGDPSVSIASLPRRKV